MLQSLLRSRKRKTDNRNVVTSKEHRERAADLHPTAFWASASMKPWQWVQIGVLGGLLAALYYSVVPAMVAIWWNDPGYSHGLLIPPLALYFAWTRREEVLSQPAVSDGRGLWLTAAACLVYLLGKLGAEFFLMRVSMVLLLGGLVWTFWGARRLRTLAFPLVLLLTMVPLPAVLYNRLAAPLQLFASGVATWALQGIGIPVFQDGNIIHLSNASLGVAEACSGLRSISSLSVLALVLGYLLNARLGARATLFLLAIPTAIAVNVLRIVGTALVAERNLELAEGFYHSFSGWLVFLVGFGGLYLQGVVLTAWTNGSAIGNTNKAGEGSQANHASQANRADQASHTDQAGHVHAATNDGATKP
jgi:exosortase